MVFDNQCPSPPQGLEIPTLVASKTEDPCDRTDYGAVEEMSQKTGTSEQMYAEAENYLKELVDVNQKFNLGINETELKQQSDQESQMAYDLNQYRLASPGVFQIDSLANPTGSPRSIGSGFAVGTKSNDCQIITDYHVVTEDDGSTEPGITVINKDGVRATAKVELLEPETDLALLSVPTSKIGTCPVLPLANKAENLIAGYDRITSIGHPGSSDHQFVSGGTLIRIDRRHKEINDHSDGKIKPWKDNVVGEVSSHVFGGFSGGPTMANGEVVGATQYKRSNYEMFFTPVEDIHSLLARAKDADGPMSCSNAMAKVRERIDRGEKHSASFSGYKDQIRSEYSFSDGSQYIIDETKNACEKSTQTPTS